MKSDSEIIEMLQSIITDDSKRIRITHVDLPNRPKDCEKYGCSFLIDNVKSFYTFIRNDNIELEGNGAEFLNKPSREAYKGISIVDEFKGHQYIHNIFDVPANVYDNVNIEQDESGKIIITSTAIPYIIELSKE